MTLLERAKRHIDQMAPHQRQRAAGLLLSDLVVEIDRLCDKYERAGPMNPTVQLCGKCGNAWFVTHFCPAMSGAAFQAGEVGKPVTAQVDAAELARLRAEVRALRAAAAQASFCLRTLLPQDADAQMTVRHLRSALGLPVGAE